MARNQFGNQPKSWPSALLSGAGFVAGVAFLQVYKRYAAILTRGGPDEVAAYNALRRRLAQGGRPARIYAERLRVALDAVDHFFGDASMADRTLWPHVFWLHTRAPLWTAPAFDRCLQLALLYPIVTIFIIWVASGHVGPAEHALHLPSGLPGSRRPRAAIVTGAAGTRPAGPG